METINTPIEGLLIVAPTVFEDDRGCFLETYNKHRHQEAGIQDDFVQDNLSVSRRGVVRGLHFQNTPYAQGKLVSVPKGRVWDVAVDIRKGSPTFGSWYGVELSGENRKQFWIPKGFAHGFIALEDDTIFSYKCSAVYAKECEGGILWNDPDLVIQWPVKSSEVIVSEKDKELPTWKVFCHKNR
jgi:dTDP-4-dehydrorhamnose 3,5-epimerase